MPNLKQDNLRLYKNIKLQAYLHLILGSSLIFLPTGQVNPTAAPLSTALGRALIYFGVVYIILAAIFGIGLFQSRKNYRIARVAVALAAIYSSFWAVLLVGIFTQTSTRAIAYITVFFWYVAYTQYHLFKDPGWKAIEIVHDITENGNDGFKRITK